MEQLADWTNKYAEQRLEGKEQSSWVRAWQPAYKDELYEYLGVLIHIEQLNSKDWVYIGLLYGNRQVSEVRVRLGITSGYARPPKVRDISSKYYPPLLVVAPTFRRVFKA